MAFASSAYAQNLLFTNGSASTLDGLYISDSGSGNWEENLLGGQRLAPGEQIQINIQGTYGKFDLMVSSGSASRSTMSIRAAPPRSPSMAQASLTTSNP